MNRTAKVGLAALVAALMAVGGGYGAGAAIHHVGTLPDAVTATAQPHVVADKKHPPKPAPPKPVEFTIVGVGDVLLHEPVNRSAGRAGPLDYSPLLAGLDPWIRGADLAICNFETPVAPPGQAVTTYPVFGIPAQIVTDLADQGWDGCSTASNHTLDRGVAGVTATLDTFDVAHLGHVGSGRTEAEANSPQIYQIVRKDRTITIAHIAMAYGTNGIPIPASAPWAVNIIDTDWAIGQAVAARQAGADMVVVSMHDGVEYQATPTQEQLSSAQALAESGQVDLVIGHHVHVPQPIVKLDGGPRGEGMWVAYGLGNFLSNQSSACCAAATSNGILMTATVIAQPGQPPQVTGVTWTATTVDIKAGHRIRVISDAINEPGAGTLSVAQLQARRDLVAGVVGDVAPERTSPPTPAPGVTVTVVPRETPQ